MQVMNLILEFEIKRMKESETIKYYVEQHSTLPTRWDCSLKGLALVVILVLPHPEGDSYGGVYVPGSVYMFMQLFKCLREVILGKVSTTWVMTYQGCYYMFLGYGDH